MLGMAFGLLAITFMAVGHGPKDVVIYADLPGLLLGAMAITLGLVARFQKGD